MQTVGLIASEAICNSDGVPPLEPFGLGTCVAATHARRFFSQVEIFPTEGLVFGGADVPEAPRAMVLLSQRIGVPQLRSLTLLWWRVAGLVLDLCYRAPLFPLRKPPGA